MKVKSETSVCTVIMLNTTIAIPIQRVLPTLSDIVI